MSKRILDGRNVVTIYYGFDGEVLRHYQVLANPDVNGDGEISVVDLAYFQENFTNPNPPASSVSDFNCDGSVAVTDLSYWQSHFIAPDPAAP